MSMKNKTALVTGGAGFIGSNLVDGLLAAGAEKVYIFDNYSTGFEYNIMHLDGNGRVEIYFHDIVNPFTCKMPSGHQFSYSTNHLEEVIKNAGVDYVFHMAAKLEILHCDPLEDARVNILGTLNVLNACLESDVKKVVYASSGAVYGDYKYWKTPYRIEDECIPMWYYGASKLAAENYLEVYRRLHGLDSATLRYSNVYGPREWYGRVLSVFVKNLIEGKGIEIFGNGHQERDFIDVRDAVAATIIVADFPSSGASWNVSSGDAITIHDLAYKLISYLKNGNIHKEFYDNVKFTDPAVGEKGRKPMELKYCVLEPNVKTEISFDQGIQDYIEWVKKEGLSRWTYPMRT